jgi:proline iminopeptidase
VYPEIEPYADGILRTGGERLYWEESGDPEGRPAVVLHGGPGSGCTSWHRRLFDPSSYRIVLFDQRGCGRSTPPASDPNASLAANTTQNLVADMELLRSHLKIDEWLVLGGSWGSTLALAYAEAYPGRVSEMVLWGVTTGRRSECDWLFRGGVAPLFPEQWERLLAPLPAGVSGGKVVEAYSDMLEDPDPRIRRRAALEWCRWESATPDWPPLGGLAERFEDPDYALAYARLVTHYVKNDLFLEDGALLRGAGALAGIPGILVNGRFDLQAPIGNAWALKRVWPGADLVVVGDAGHSGGDPAISRELVRATDRFASA